MMTHQLETGRADARPAAYILRQAALAMVLVAVPVAAFTAVELAIARPAASPASEVPPAALGDLSAFTVIATDVGALIDKGDLVGAEKRATEIETAWDDAQPKLQKMNAEAWGNVDAAADALFHALRAKAPDPAAAKAAIDGLLAALASPVGTSGSNKMAGVALVSSIAVTDANGHALPCEQLIGQLRSKLGSPTAPADKVKIGTEALNKALERCNADDDTNANTQSAAGLAALAQQ